MDACRRAAVDLHLQQAHIDPQLHDLRPSSAASQARIDFAGGVFTVFQNVIDMFFAFQSSLSRAPC